MTRLPAFLLFAALLAVPATARAETITIVKPPAQPPVQTVGVKPSLGHGVPVLITVSPVDEDCCYDPPENWPPEDNEDDSDGNPPTP